MRAENHAMTFGHLFERIDEDRAFALQSFQHETVVDYLVANVERPSVIAQGAANCSTARSTPAQNPARLGEDDFFNRCFARQHDLSLDLNRYWPLGQYRPARASSWMRVLERRGA